jgi:hypothetical protein
MSSEIAIFEAALNYTKLGMIVHPLLNPNAPEINPETGQKQSPGKGVLVKDWQKRERILTEAEIIKYWGSGGGSYFDNANIGLQCGKRSGFTLIDVDDWNPAIWNELTSGLSIENWLMSKRTNDRSHIYFKYTVDLKAQKHHDLGIEILTDGNNAVLPPSRHKSGQTYSFNREIRTLDDVPEMAEEFINRLMTLFGTNNKLKVILQKCKPCLREKFKAHQESPNIKELHTSTGRQLTLALMADLKANDADAEVLHLACKYLFREDYNRSQSDSELGPDGGKIKKPWKCETVQRELGSITLADVHNSKCGNCTFRGQTHQISSQKKSEPEAQKENPLNIDYDEMDLRPELVQQAEEDADRVLREGDPIDYILNTIAKKHVGDRDTQEAICVSIACQCCLNTAGLQISVNGTSGSGKSHGIKTHLHLIPKKWKRVTGLSAKAAYYMNLAPGIIIFSDDKDPDPAFEEVIKQATTNFQEETYYTTVKDQKQISLVIPPRINWYLTSVESFVSDQLLNRQLTFDADSSPEQKKRIFDAQKHEAANGGNGQEINIEVLTCRRLYGALKNNLFKVKIPFVNRIDLQDTSNSRIFPMFLDMVRGFAAFKWKQRTFDGDGYLIAELEDFEKAKRLFEAQKENTVTKMNENERRIIQCIASKGKCTINDISSSTDIKYQSVRRALVGRTDRDVGGLLDKIKGLKMEEETDTNYERAGDILKSSSGKKALKFSINESKFDYWSLFDKEFIFLKDA